MFSSFLHAVQRHAGRVFDISILRSWEWLAAYLIQYRLQTPRLFGKFIGKWMNVIYWHCLVKPYASEGVFAFLLRSNMPCAIIFVQILGYVSICFLYLLVLCGVTGFWNLSYQLWGQPSTGCQPITGHTHYSHTIPTYGQLRWLQFISACFWTVEGNGKNPERTSCQ